MFAAPCWYGDGFLFSHGRPASPKCHASMLAMAKSSEISCHNSSQMKKWEQNLAQWWEQDYGQQPGKLSPTHNAQPNSVSRGVNPELHSRLAFSRELQKLCDEGLHAKAVRKLLLMENESTFPSESCYRYILRGCKELSDVKQVQAHLVRRNLELSHPLGEVIVVSLLKCGALQDGLQVFFDLPFRTVFSWSAVICHYVECNRSHEAFKMYHLMQEEGIEPNEYTYVSLLKACGSIPDLEMGHMLHEQASRKGFSSNPFVANTLISMYGKCGRIIEAEDVFYSLKHRNLISWNAMLSAYVEQNEAEVAIRLYKEMQNEGVNPNNRTFVFLCQACSLLSDQEASAYGRHYSVKASALQSTHYIHTEIVMKGLGNDSFVSNSLLKAYGKCGSVDEAACVFYGLPHRDVVSWNALLSVFVEHGQSEKALRLYRQMHEEGVIPDERTFVNVLQACCKFSENEEVVSVDGHFCKPISLRIVQGLHSDARKMNLDSNVFISNTLVTLYGKCGSISEAENVLICLYCRDTVTWTAMLSAYLQQDKPEKALLLYRQMLQESINPDERTLAIALQACSLIAEKEEAMLKEDEPVKTVSLEIGHALHEDTKRMGFLSDSFVKIGLLSLYGKCGCMEKAENMFTDSLSTGVVSWNAMLSVYNDHGEAEKALKLYRQMQEEGVIPDERTFLILLQSCCILAETEEGFKNQQSVKCISLDVGRSIHRDLSQRGYLSDPYLASALVSFYGKLEIVEESENVFSKASNPHGMLWNAMLMAYLDQSEAEKTLQLYCYMKRSNVQSDKGTFVIALQAVCVLADNERAQLSSKRFIKTMSLNIGQKLHKVIEQQGFDSDVFVANMLLTMYGKCRSISEAEEVFANMSHRDTISWNAMFSAYLENGQGENVLELFKEMQRSKVVIDDITLGCILRACSMTGMKDVCREIHFMIVSAGFDTNLVLATTLIHAYGTCALTADAQVIFNKLHITDTMSWTALIDGYAREGNFASSLITFKKMHEANIKPTPLTFLSVLMACSHAGFVDDGVTYFESMIKDYNIEPKLEHYVCLIDLLGRAGDMKRLEDILSRTPLLPDPSFWIGLLNACQKHGNISLAKVVFERAIHLQSSHPAAFVLMSNILLQESVDPSHCNDSPRDIRKQEQSSLEST